MSRIPDFETEHFHVDGRQIEEWNEGKLPLPEGAGCRYMAPKDLIATLKEPFLYDWNYEAGGLVGKGSVWWPTLVYGEEWVGQEIRHFPYCKELREINDCYLTKHGWSMPISWEPIAKSIKNQFVSQMGELLGTQVQISDISDQMWNTIFRNCFNIELSGHVWGGNFIIASGWLNANRWLSMNKRGLISGIDGEYWSAQEYSECNTYCRDCCFFVKPADWHDRLVAFPIRCASEQNLSDS